MYIPLWVLVATYIVGMCVIGYPMGYYSLKVWKHPIEYSFARKLLFPISSQDRKITNISKASMLADILNTDRALKNSDRQELMRYVFSSMLLWPMRFSYLVSLASLWVTWKLFAFTMMKIVYPILTFVCWVIGSFTGLGAKGLLACKKCSQI